jgi:hypothetical protein
MALATITMPSHYSILKLESMAALRELFPSGKADDMNFVMFSTSGVHGTYTTIEEAEAELQHGEAATITVVVVHPRIVCMRYGNLVITMDDVPFLKKLRSSSRAAFAKIG